MLKWSYTGDNKLGGANMQLELGKRIRELRRRDGRTQEDLAEAIGVTSQAVSRWEANGGYPDMEMIPTIAHYFGITIDELFGYESDRERKIDAIIEHSEELHQVDQGTDKGVDECISYLRDALIEFPGNERIMLRLAIVLRDAGFVRDGQHSLWDKDGYFAQDVERHRKNKYWLEAVKVLEKLSAQTSGEMLFDVRCELVMFYDLLGEYDKASALAGTFPIIQISRQAMVKSASNGKKRSENSGKYVIELVNELANGMVSALQMYRGNFDDDTAVETVQNAIKLFDLVFTDKNYGRSNGTLVTLYLWLSSLQYRIGMKDEAFESLDKAYEHAKAFTDLAKKTDAYYTAPLLTQIKIDVSGLNRDPRELPKDWPWWFIPDPEDIEEDIKSDPRWAEWVKKTNE